MPESWQGTLDTLRPPRGEGRGPVGVAQAAAAPGVLRPARAHQLGRRAPAPLAPVVQRILGRFLAQGWSSHDLSRVTVVRNPHDGIARVIAFGRLSLFGAGATRLHDQLVSVAAPWNESGGGNHLRPFAEEADRDERVDNERIGQAEGVVDTTG
jgi:hypothetical protein